MKTSTKLKIVGFGILAVGLVLIVLGAWVFRDKDWTLGWKPNFGLFVSGLFMAVLSFPILGMGFLPSFAKMGAKLQNETLDSAGTEIGTAMHKTANLASPAIQTTAKAIKKGFSEETMYCKSCGKEIVSDSAFCKFCGTKQN